MLRRCRGVPGSHAALAQPRGWVFSGLALPACRSRRARHARSLDCRPHGKQHGHPIPPVKVPTHPARVPHCLRPFLGVVIHTRAHAPAPHPAPPHPTPIPLQIKRTEGVSTTDIVGRMLMCSRDNARFAAAEQERLTLEFSMGNGDTGAAAPPPQQPARAALRCAGRGACVCFVSMHAAHGVRFGGPQLRAGRGWQGAAQPGTAGRPPGQGPSADAAASSQYETSRAAAAACGLAG